MIASASTGAQQVVTGTLAELAAGGVEVDPPATLVTGPTVALAGSSGWFVPTPATTSPGRPWSAGRRAERQPGDHLVLIDLAGELEAELAVEPGRAVSPGTQLVSSSVAPGRVRT